MAFKKGNPVIIPAVVAVTVVCLAATALVLLRLGMLPIAQADKRGGGEFVQWKLDEFLVNLADRDDARYLKVNMVLEVKGRVAEGKEGQASLEEIKARDAIITVLSKKTYRGLITEDGKLSLKAELKNELNEGLDGIRVENIYFTSFAMQ